MKQLLLLGILLLGLSACAQAGDSLPPTAVLPTAEQSAPPPQPPTAGPTIPAAQPIPTESAGPSAPTPEPPPTAVPTSGPIAVTYFTPAQQEGPYYTLDKPVDRDSDLVDLAGAAGLPAGQILEFDGTVYNAGGLPISGLTIEIWQTDASGIYLHPGDPDTASRDPNFQFYGETITDASGHYSFRTILPGQYEPRPPHIHFKVKRDGQELLTSQFYFSGDPGSETIDPALLLTALPAQDAAGTPILTAQRDIILAAP